MWLPVIYLKALGIPWTKQMDTVSSLKSRTMTISEVATWVLFESILNGFRMILVTNASTTVVKKIRPQPRVPLYILIPIVGFIGAPTLVGKEETKRYWNLRISYRKDFKRHPSLNKTHETVRPQKTPSLGGKAAAFCQKFYLR